VENAVANDIELYNVNNHHFNGIMYAFCILKRHGKCVADGIYGAL